MLLNHYRVRRLFQFERLQKFYQLYWYEKKTLVFGETTQIRRQLISGGWLVSETIYDSQGRVIFSTDSHLEDSTDPVYDTKSVYDSQGRSVGSIRYEGCKIDIAADGALSIAVTGTEVYRTSTEYDTKGRVHSSIDALGNITSQSTNTTILTDK
ncbi:MAG: hypothetical protein LBL62_07850 [Planctomycetaceae bacterium]|jgi:hypothetical protein|nr:hypothetical protein [Planctomycetaceae bacterium]